MVPPGPRSTFLNLETESSRFFFNEKLFGETAGDRLYTWYNCVAN